MTKGIFVILQLGVAAVLTAKYGAALVFCGYVPTPSDSLTLATLLMVSALGNR